LAVTIFGAFPLMREQFCTVSCVNGQFSWVCACQCIYSVCVYTLHTRPLAGQDLYGRLHLTQCYNSSSM